MDSLEKHDPDMLRVAVLLSKGRKQTEIAEQLGLHASKVSRLAKKAIDEARILEPQPPKLLLDDEQFRKIDEDLGGREKLAAKLRNNLERPFKLEIIEVTNSDRDVKDYVREVAVGAARYLSSSVLPGMTDVGLTWGFTLQQICEELTNLFAKPEVATKLDRSLRFHQCTGDTHAALNNPSQRAGTMVAELNHVLERRGETFSIGATIPKGFDDDIATIRKYFMSTAGYSAMFKIIGESGIALKHHLNAVISGCGDGSDADIWCIECASAANIKPEQLSRMVIGNVGGTWIPRAQEFESAVTEINDRWNGLSVTDLGSLVASGNVVCLVAAEKRKAEVALKAIELGYASHLVASVDLVERMIEVSEKNQN